MQINVKLNLNIFVEKSQSVIAVPGVHEYGNDEKVDDQPAQRILVSDIHVHENFDSRTFRNDIALLKLSEPIQFSGKMNFHLYLF